MRKLRLHDCWAQGDFASSLGMDAEHVQRTLRELTQLGFIEMFKHGEMKLWRTTLKGNSLALAKFSRPVSRKCAQKHLDALIERARVINEDGRYLFYVERLVLFGSFLDPKNDPVGDVDVAYELVRREMTNDEFSRRSRAQVAAANRNFSNFLDQLTWPQESIRLVLKHRSRVLSLTTADDGVLNLPTTETQVVYQRRSTP